MFIAIGNTTAEALHRAGIKNVIKVEKDNRYGVIEWFKKDKEKIDKAKPRYELIEKMSKKLPCKESNALFDKEADFLTWYENNYIFYPHSSLSSETITLALQELGFNVTSVIAYNNELPNHPRRVNLNHFKRIVFTSPSTIDNFIKLYGKLPENTEFITRGPITQDHLEEILNK